MKIKCVYNNRNKIPDHFTEKYPSSLDNLSLIIEKEYLVYAITEFFGFIWFCICDENFTYYPRYRQFFLFEITDSRLSHYWSMSLMENEYKKFIPCLAFPEWAFDEYYYSKLVDGHCKEKDIFNKYKEQMDLEFPDLSITVNAEIGDEEWLICTSCKDAWKSLDLRNAMVRCPKCKIVLHNPRYINSWNT